MSRGPVYVAAKRKVARIGRLLIAEFSPGGRGIERLEKLGSNRGSTPFLTYRCAT